MSTLRIYGDIGEYSPDGMEAISARMVADFLETADDQVTVRINSRGGDVQEGWAIHDLLVNSGKKIKTIGEGRVYSIATIIFLAGDEREMLKNADGLIHNPYIPPFTLADAYESADLHKIAAELEQEEQKILAFYVERTGSPIETLSEYMKNDTKLSAEDMLKLGFATKVIEPVRAYAYIRTNLTNMKDEKAFFEKLGEALDGAVAKIKNLSRLPQVDQTLTDKDGNEFTVVRETGSPEVGDKASPDGTYTLTDGKVITIADGTITEVKEAEAPDELADAKETIATLEAKITELETAQAAKVEEIAAKEAEVTAKEAEAAKVVSEAQALVTELSALKNEWKPEGRSKMNTVVDKVGSVDLARVKEIRKKLTEKSE